MSDQEYTELLLKNSNPRSPDPRSVAFVKNEVVPRVLSQHQGAELHVLEIGAGLSTLFDDQGLLSALSDKQIKVTSIDISEVAVSFLSNLAHPLGESHSIECLNILQANWIRRFDLIIDTSCFHCLCGEGQQEDYLKTISRALKRDGLFFLQTMVTPKKLALEEELSFDEKREVIQFQTHDWRRLREAITIEKLFDEHGLDIEYFRVQSDEKFVLSKERDFPMNSDPDLLRVMARL